MRKTTSLKVSLFAFLSAIACTVANYMLSLEIVFYSTQVLWFAAYFFLLISLSQVIYEKFRFRITFIILLLSFALAAYSLALFSLVPYGGFFEYYVIFFYLFGITALVSTIILIARIVFSSPIIPEETAEDDNLSVDEYWVCSCGKENTGKFCSECGKSNSFE